MGMRVRPGAARPAPPHRAAPHRAPRPSADPHPSQELCVEPDPTYANIYANAGNLAGVRGA
jgi:hypothetical protein